MREGGSPEGEAGVPANGGIGSDKVDRSCLPLLCLHSESGSKRIRNLPKTVQGIQRSPPCLFVWLLKESSHDSLSVCLEGK